MKMGINGKLVLVVALPSIALLTGALVIARTQPRPARDSMPRDATQDSTYHPLPKEAIARYQARAARIKVVEDEARDLFAKGRYAAAEVACRRALSMWGKANDGSSDPQALQLLGEILMAQDRNKEALPCFYEAMLHTRDTTLSLDTALAYCRLGDIDKASHFYSDRMILHHHLMKPEYLPGTHTIETFEASILFARGLEAYFTGLTEKAVHDYAAAARIVPTNALIADFQARALRELKRYPEAARCFAVAATFGDKTIAQRATNSLAAWPKAERDKAMAEAAKLKADKP